MTSYICWAIVVLFATLAISYLDEGKVSPRNAIAALVCAALWPAALGVIIAQIFMATVG